VKKKSTRGRLIKTGVEYESAPDSFQGVGSGAHVRILEDEEAK
jgi:hypothetical protein